MFLHHGPIRVDVDWSVVRDFSRHAHAVSAPPGGPGALDDRPLRYSVIEGETIRRALPWLWAAFRTPEILAEFSRHAGAELVPYAHDPAFINLNVMAAGQDYQLHQDGNDVTLVIFLTDVDAADGGALQCLLHDASVTIQPVAGMGVLFTASEIPHRVLPLRPGAASRLTLPVAYSFVGSVRMRDPALDLYLHGRRR
jgi:hypothetical protein